MGEYKLGRAFLVVFYGDDSSDMVFPVCANWRRLLRKVRVGGINVRNLDRATSGRMENLEDMGEWNGFFFFRGKLISIVNMKFPFILSLIHPYLSWMSGEPKKNCAPSCRINSGR